MKKMIKKTSALAISAFMLAQYIPFSAMAATDSTHCDLYIHPYILSQTDYDTAKGQKDTYPPTGQTADKAHVPAGNNVATTMTFDIIQVDPDGSAYTGTGTAVSLSEVSAVAADSTTPSAATLPDGFYKITPHNNITETDVNFKDAEAFIIQIPAYSVGGNVRDVHIYPKFTDNDDSGTTSEPDPTTIDPTTDFHAIQLTKSLSDPNDSMSTLSATFDAYYEDAAGNWVVAGSYTTNSSGEILIDGLPLGTYYLVETAAPDGYMIDKTPIAFTVNGVNSTNTIKTMTNEKKLTVDKEIANDAAGNIYNWVIKGDIPDEPSKLRSYVITDSFSAAALENVAVSSVKVGGVTLTSGTDYTVSAITTSEGTSTFTITFETPGLAKLDKDTTNDIETVDITVSSTIVSGYSSASVSNSAKIAYTYGATSTGPVISPTPDPVDYPTTPVDPNTPTEDTKEVTLATLIISNTGSGELIGATYSIKNEAGTEVLTANDSESNDPTNTAQVANIAPGHYLVYQTAPGTNTNNDVYLVCESPIDIYVKDNGTIYSNAAMTSEFTTHNTIVFENTKKGTFNLPFTGTTATIIFTITGILLMAGTGFLIFILLKKRDDDEEDEEQVNN